MFKMDTNELIKRMELIFPMENVTKNRFQKSGINGLILGSATDAMLSTLEIDGEKFTFLERSMILAYRDQIKAEEAHNQRKLDEKEAQNQRKLDEKEAQNQRKLDEKEAQNQRKLDEKEAQKKC